MEFFDSHAHYNDEKFNDDRENIIQEVYSSDITKLINAGYSLESSKKAIEISQNYDFMYATAGISPNDINKNYKLELEQIVQLAKNKKVVAIGEIGLDYYWNKENKEEQKNAFIEQIEIANQLKLPIVIHSRDASFDTIDVIKNKIECKEKGVFHCCQLNIDLVREALKLGFYISFAGPITFKNSKNAKEIVSMVPLEKMLIETDSPYLAPEPLRGTRNNSTNIKLIAGKIAELKEVEFEKIARVTYENAKTIFKIK